MESVFLDTDIIIDFLRNKSEAVDFIESTELTSRLATSYINLFELYYGAMKSAQREHNTKAVEELEERLLILNLSKESVKEAGKILALLEKSGEIIDFRDILIGTVALKNKFKIKTNNKKHFSKIIGLEII